MKSNQRKVVGVFTAITSVLMLLAGWIATQPRKEALTSSGLPIAPTNKPQPISSPSSIPGAGSTNVFDALAELKGRLEKGDASTNRRLLTSFVQTRFSSETSTRTVEELIRFLDSGLDCPTGLKFRVGPGHKIEEWPTLRVAVLDWLRLLSPTAAASYAEVIFSKTKSGDEYAVALRNYALGRPDDKAALEKHFVELLGNDVWEATPTEGYLEAYDVAVHLADASLVAPLADRFANTENELLRRASFIALDRMAQANPIGVLRVAAKDPSLAAEPRIRAGLMGRLDIRNPDQRALLETYLLDSAVNEKEISYFLEAFPNGSGVVLHGLLSSNLTVNFADLARQDRQALIQIQEWQTDARFESRWPALKQLEGRLTEYVASAVRGGLLAPTLPQ